MSFDPDDLTGSGRPYPALTTLTPAERLRVHRAAGRRPLLAAERVAYTIAARSPFWDDAQIDAAVEEALDAERVPIDLRPEATREALRIIGAWQDDAVRALTLWEPPGRAN